MRVCSGTTLDITQSTCAAGACVDLSDSVDCVTVLPNATGTCDVDHCAVATCAAGFSDCDGDDSTGCEVRGACTPGCGNGFVEAGEACDDGNTADGDGCSATCELEGGGACGDGTVDAGEDCDTSGASASCDDDCTFSSCGDGTLNAFAGEE
ncbi:MAG: hypothetical protein H6697_03660, partial [Myxococcales bacterium]|nr:hypothetical protein [Myxococcales bacterium]